MDLQSSDISESAPEQQSDDLNHVRKLIDANSASVTAMLLAPAHADEQLTRTVSSKHTASSDNGQIEAVTNEPNSTLRSPRSVAAGILIAHLVQT